MSHNKTGNTNIKVNPFVIIKFVLINSLLILNNSSNYQLYPFLLLILGFIYYFLYIEVVVKTKPIPNVILIIVDYFTITPKNLCVNFFIF